MRRLGHDICDTFFHARGNAIDIQFICKRCSRHMTRLILSYGFYEALIKPHISHTQVSVIHRFYAFRSDVVIQLSSLERELHVIQYSVDV